MPEFWGRALRSSFVVWLLVFASVGCAPAQYVDDDADREVVPEVEAARTRVESESPLRAGTPVTLRMPLPDALRAHLRQVDTADTTLRLRLEDLVQPPVGATVRVFVNQPDATVETSLESASYAGEVGFFPLQEDHLDPRSFLLDLTPVLRRLPIEQRSIEGGHLEVTLVLVTPMMPESAEEELEEVEVPFAGVSLEAVPVPASSD